MELTNVASFERLTGLAFFTPADGPDAGIALPFGNIKMLKLATSPKTAEIPLAKRGGLTLARRDTYQVTPVYEITSDQFSTPTFALQLMGDQQANLVQASATASTYTFTAKAGRAYYIGSKNITIQHVKVGATEAVAGTDYFVDDPNIPLSSPAVPISSLNGWIIIPMNLGAVIVASATVVVTYDTPALTREQFVAFTKLNRSGSLTVIGEDATGADPRAEWVMTVQLSVKDVGHIDPTKFSETVLEASIFGYPKVTKKQN